MTRFERLMLAAFNILILAAMRPARSDIMSHDEKIDGAAKQWFDEYKKELCKK